MLTQKCVRFFVMLAVFSLTPYALGHDLSSLRILYIGDNGTLRSRAYRDFLKQRVLSVESVDRHKFDPPFANRFDVILLDWPHGPETLDLRHLTSPLGPRETWAKPTVLLGSAGLHLAIAWKLKGGVGCTCLDPIAYNLREHEIFDVPFKIDRTLTSIPTPMDFKDEISDANIRVLPLVDAFAATNGRAPGWCTYTPDFPRYPDVELFCGGVNHKTPTAAGLWRQGNLFHFGFDLSPGQMNNTAKLLLLNSIAYISRFTEDRPIAVTPSVFAGKVAPSKEWILRHLRESKYPTEFATSAFAPGVLPQSIQGSREQLLAWAQTNCKFLYPNADQLLDFDHDLMAINTSFDEPAFLDAVDRRLAGNPEEQSRGGRLVARYIPQFTAAITADSFRTWLDENRPYLFASDSGDYRWYIDPLAHKRHIPTDKLRGATRADNSGPTASR